MTFESIRGYLQLASGLVEVTRAKATEAAMSLLTLPSTISGGTLSAQAQDLAEELMAAAAANRSNLIALVRSEVEKAVAKASVMSLDELDRARAGMAKLSSDVEELRDEVLRRPAVRAVPGVSEMSAMLGVRPGSPPANGPTGGAVVSASSPLALSPLAETIPTVASVLPPPAKNPRKARATRRTQPVVASSASESVVTRSPATAHSPVKTATKAAATKAPTTKASTTKAPTTKAAATKARTTKARTTKAAATKGAATKAAATRAAATKAAATKAATPTTKKAPRKNATKKAATRKVATKRAASKSTATTSTTTGGAR